MSYKTLLVCLSNKEEAERLLPVAIVVARQFNAHLIGLHYVQSMEMYASVSTQLSGAALAEMSSIHE